MNEAYRQTGHKYRGRNVGRGCRQVSKVVRAVNGMASYDLLDEVAREDARRRREQERVREVAA
jgi:hypothetical protein